MRKTKKKYRNWTREELVEKLREWAQEHGKPPSMHDLNNDPSMPSASTYVRIFGGLNNAKEDAGLEIYEPAYAKEYLLNKLKEFAEKHGRSPSVNDFDNDKSLPNHKAYFNAFGSWNNAIREAGLEIFQYDSKLNYLGELLTEYKRERKKELADATLRHYLKNLKLLEDFLKEKQGKKMNEIALKDIKNFVFEIKSRYSRTTIKSIFTSIQNFFAFIIRKSIIEKSEPIIDIATIELTKKFFKEQLHEIEDDSEEDEALSEEEVAIIKEKLLDYPVLHNLFVLDLNLGLRASEFVKIKVKEGMITSRKQARKGDLWLDLSRGILMIYRCKTRRPHLVVLTSKMKEVVKKQLMLRKLYGVKHEYLFFSVTGIKLRSDSVHKYYRKISSIVGFRVTSHKVRRTMSTMLEKRGIPHSIIRIRMGHAPRDTTEIYQRYPIKERQKILEEKVSIL